MVVVIIKQMISFSWANNFCFKRRRRRLLDLAFHCFLFSFLLSFSFPSRFTKSRSIFVRSWVGRFISSLGRIVVVFNFQFHIFFFNKLIYLISHPHPMRKKFGATLFSFHFFPSTSRVVASEATGQRSWKTPSGLERKLGGVMERIMIRIIFKGFLQIKIYVSKKTAQELVVNTLM